MDVSTKKLKISWTVAHDELLHVRRMYKFLRTPYDFEEGLLSCEMVNDCGLASLIEVDDMLVASEDIADPDCDKIVVVVRIDGSVIATNGDQYSIKPYSKPLRLTTEDQSYINSHIGSLSVANINDLFVEDLILSINNELKMEIDRQVVAPPLGLL